MRAIGSRKNCLEIETETNLVICEDCKHGLVCMRRSYDIVENIQSRRAMIRKVVRESTIPKGMNINEIQFVIISEWQMKYHLPNDSNEKISPSSP